MKRVRKIPFFKSIKEIREYQFGTFYFFDRLVISEINEGQTFGWKMAKRVIDAAGEIYGDGEQVAYISNRINTYHVVPTDWAKFYTNRHRLGLYSVVGSTKGNFASLVMERMFFKSSIRQFSDLEEAIHWSLGKLKTNMRTITP